MNKSIFLIFLFLLTTLLLGQNLFNQTYVYFSLTLLVIVICSSIYFFKSITFSKETFSLTPKTTKLLLASSIVILLLLRITFLSQSEFSGYDSGLYKFFFEENQKSLQTNGEFSQITFFDKMYPLGSSIFGVILLKSFLTSEVVVNFSMIFLEILLLFMMFVTLRLYFNETIASISCLLCSISLTQFQVFWYVYYKNIFGLFLIFLSLYFLKKNKHSLMILSGGLLAGIHRPSFFLFGLVYFLEFLQYRTKKLFISGSLIILLAFSFYSKNFEHMVLRVIDDSIMSLTQYVSSGSFISFETFLMQISYLLPFFLFGFIWSIIYKKYNVFFYWLVISFTIVLIEFYFYNRMIIFLNIIVIIYSSIGISFILKNLHKISSVLLLSLIVFLGVFSTLVFMFSIQPLLTQEEFETISQISTITPQNSSVIYIDSYYAPWLIGWSQREILGEGILSSKEISLSGLLKNQSLKINKTTNTYIFLGRIGKENAYSNSLEDSLCFTVIFENLNSKLFQYNKKC